MGQLDQSRHIPNIVFADRIGSRVQSSAPPNRLILEIKLPRSPILERSSMHKFCDHKRNIFPKSSKCKITYMFNRWSYRLSIPEPRLHAVRCGKSVSGRDAGSFALSKREQQKGPAIGWAFADPVGTGQWFSEFFRSVASRSMLPWMASTKERSNCSPAMAFASSCKM